MREAEATESGLLDATAAARGRVRELVRTGRWMEAEPDTERLAGYVQRHVATAAPAGAEAIQGDTSELQAVRFLPLGSRVRRAVGYVEVTTPTSATMGSGFLVSPRVFLTNAHVIGDADTATGAVVAFDRELDETGRPRPVTTYLLAPEALALFSDDDALDYALIAVGARTSGEAMLADLGFCPLSDRPDKHVIGMPVNIVQHPRGWPKMVAVRNNFLAFRTDATLLYETDTDEGSSGSPVFNDDWEVVALHHWGQPHLDTDDDEGKPFPVTVNEGIRISAIHRDLAARLDRDDLSPTARELLTEVLGASALSLAGATGGVPVLSAPRPKVLSRGPEAVKVDQDYTNREGYDPGFIDDRQVPLPAVVTDALAVQLAPLRADLPDAAGGELRYEHFSLKLNKATRLAIFTATNIDGPTYLAVDRATGQVGSEGDTWFKDNRVSNSYFLDQTFYSEWSHLFDRGHLTRRTDPTWGTEADAERANADTFHFTNCSPQHFRFNQTARYWQGIERYVLENGVLATGRDERLCVFQGPLFDDTIDRWADDVQIPSSFWKIVVWEGAAELRAVGMVVDQLALLDETRRFVGLPKDLPAVDVQHWRVAIPVIESRTGLDFGSAVRDADTIARPDQPAVGAEAAHRITTYADIQL
ncbi:MAG TPA: DNA/RNA non-specific endonuclease [Acidimicrobiales bacterium]|nr:DNA/RNA non-specific endonuclease [Acidimicrobiales bacterium]